MELWLKNYLGLFFNFKNFGNLSWLAIPLLIYFFLTIKKRKRWEMAIIFVFFLSCLSLGIKGHGYPRYLFTLYPFTLTVIFLFGWELIKKKSHYLQIGAFLVCGILIFFNYYHFRDTYKFFWRAGVSLSDDRFPHKTVEFINNIKDSNSISLFLICSHRHLFFYHTNKKGIDFRDPKLEFFNRQENKEAALNVLKIQLKVKYILLYWSFKPNPILRDIIENDCELIIRDRSCYLYMIREPNDKLGAIIYSYENI